MRTNEAITRKLRQMADVLEQQEADGYRVAAYRRAAATVEALSEPIESLVKSGGPEKLIALPAIGKGIAGAIVEMLTTGRWVQLERLEGTLDPEHIFQTVPGIGPKLARRLHDELHVENLEQLELSAHDGQLAKVRGFGRRRADMVRAVLNERLSRFIRLPHSSNVPPVGIILDVDLEYREKAIAGILGKIAPKRFNPAGEAWLPVLHTIRSEWQFTALFSNSQLAHELNKTNDWVIIYFHEDDETEAQCTVVTETRGPLASRRTVRGREGQCLAHYAIKSE